MIFLLVLVLVSALVLYGVSVWLPALGFPRAGPDLSVRPFSGLRPGGLLTPPAGPAARPFFGLRPFGLHREGAPGILWHLGSLVSMLTLAVITVFLVPRRVAVLARVASNGWGQRILAFTIGLLGYLGIALLTFVVFINIVGWPLVIVIGLGVYVATVLGLVAVGLALGSAICRFVRVEGGPLFRLGVGVLVLFLVSLVPYVGWLVVAASAMLGFGAVLWTRGGDVSGWSLQDTEV